jgi:hypothetical protein
MSIEYFQNLPIDSNDIYRRFNSLSCDDKWNCVEKSYKTTWDHAMILKKIWEINSLNTEIPQNLHVLTVIQIYNLLPNNLKENIWRDYLSIFLIVESIYTDNERLQRKRNCKIFIQKISKCLPFLNLPKYYFEYETYISALFKKQNEILKYFDYSIFNLSLTINYINFFPCKSLLDMITYDVVEKNLHLLIFTDTFECSNMFMFHYLSPKDFSLMIIHHADKLYNGMYHDRLYWVNYYYQNINVKNN